MEKGFRAEKTKKYLLYGALIYTIINALTAYFMPLIDDEAYYWEWSRHLDWGYFDHPPMVALWVKIGFVLLHNELGVRLVAVLAGGLGYLIMAKTVGVKSKRDFWLYTFLYYSLVLFNVFGFIATPDAPLLFFGIIYFYALKKFIEKDSWRNTAFLGIAMALLMYSKYHAAILILFSLLPLLPKYYKNPKAYLAILLGVAAYSPHLVWQYQHDFVSANYHIVRRNVRNHFKISNLTDYLLSLIYASSPLLFFYYAKAIIKIEKTNLWVRSLIWAFGGVISFFIFTTFKRYIQVQWSLVAFIPLFIIGFLYLKNHAKSLKLIRILSIITVGLMIFVRIYLILPQAPINTKYHGWKDFMKRAGDVTKGVAVFESYQQVSLFDFYNYPNKLAINYVTLENRESQFSLWNSESQANGKNITYFSGYMKGRDSLLLKERKDRYFSYKYLDNFVSTRGIQIKIKQAQKRGNALHLVFAISNEGAEKIDLSEDKNLDLWFYGMKAPYSFSTICREKIPYAPVTLSPKETIELEANVQLCSTDKEYVAYLGFGFDVLPIRRESSLMRINKKQ